MGLAPSSCDSISYSQRLGVAADQPLPKKLDGDKIIDANQGRKSSLSKSKKKRRIFRFHKSKDNKPEISAIAEAAVSKTKKSDSILPRRSRQNANKQKANKSISTQHKRSSMLMIKKKKTAFIKILWYR